MPSTKFIDEFSKEVFEHTYKFGDETIDDTHLRVAEELSRVEKEREIWKEKFLYALRDFKFVPGGRITSNAGTGLRGTTYINCFVDGFSGEDQDSMEGIMDALKRQALILKSEGGYGFCVDPLRPKGTFIHGIGNETPGSVRMLDMWDTQSAVITAGSGKKSDKKEAKQKIRKGAQMVTMSCWHPDIEEFITAKQTPGRLTKFNMSVLVTDDFMKAVENDEDWNLIFPDYENCKEEYRKFWVNGDINSWKQKKLPIKIYKTIKARYLWELIMNSTYNRNEPGVLFIDTINRLNNLNYCEHINATNPCVAGDTKVAVADGRNAVPIKTLAEEGKDIPVYAIDNDGKTVIKMMRNPRITGYNEDVYTVVLDDGSKLKCTKNHKWRLKDGSYKETKDLKENDSLALYSKWSSTWSEILGKKCNSKSQQYWMTNNGKTNIFEHRLIYEQLTGTKIPKGYVIHHKDFNGMNNSINNLQMMTKEDHDTFHDISGDKNPVRRMPSCNWMNDPEKQKKLRTKRKGIPLSDTTKKRISKKINELNTNEKHRQKHVDGIRKTRSEKSKEWNEKMIFTRLKKRKEKLESLVNDFQNQTDLKCFFDGHDIRVVKHCEICGKEFTPLFSMREQACCSHECSQKIITQKAAKINHERAVITHSVLREKSYNLLSKFTNENNRIPSRSQFTLILKNNGINDIRTLGFGSYNSLIKDVCKRHGIEFKPPKKWSNKHYIIVGEELIDNGMVYNHKVVEIQYHGKEDVYNGTVDDVHNFNIVFTEEKTNSGRHKLLMLNNLQCGEQILPVGGVCLLGSLNLTQFVNKQRNNWDYAKLAEIIPIAIRMMDNVNDITYVPLESQREQLKNKRRIGLGVLGYGSALMMMKTRYGSDDALKLTDELMAFIANTAYSSSADIANEKGVFPAYQQEYLDSEFLKILAPETIEKIKEYGIRNSHLLSIQPTGNSSVFANNVSGGLEPLFMPEYVRTTIFPYPPEGLHVPQNVDFANKTFSLEPTKMGPVDTTIWQWTKEGDENVLYRNFNGYVWKFDQNRGLLRETVVKDYAVRDLEKSKSWNKDAEWAATAMNLNIDDHVRTMEVFSKYIDSAMSKTVNIASDYPFEDFKNLYDKVYKTGTIKGVTTYREGTMATVLASTSAVKKEIPGITKTKAPKRPKELPCDINTLMVNGQYWMVIVGLIGHDPYEIFAFPKTGIQIHHKFKKGKLIKVKKGIYNLDINDGDIILENITTLFGSNEQEALTRMVSTALRHGADIGFIVEQLQKSEGTIVSFAKSVARTLKTYISEDSVANNRILDCEVCGGKGTLRMQEGCYVCTSCSASKCS